MNIFFNFHVDEIKMYLGCFIKGNVILLVFGKDKKWIKKGCDKM